MSATVCDLNGAYAGAPVWVVCTGTSVRGFDFRWLTGEVTIGCNDAVFWLRPTIHLVNDRPLVKRYADNTEWRHQEGRDRLWHPSYPAWRYQDGQQVVAHRSCMVDYRSDPVSKRIHLYEYYTATQVSIKLQDPLLYCKFTVATAAVQLAWRMGASLIRLLGFDCYTRGKGRGHARYWWQPFDEESQINESSAEGGYIRGMRSIKAWLALVAPELQVINMSPLSPCDALPKEDWHQYFASQVNEQQLATHN